MPNSTKTPVTVTLKFENKEDAKAFCQFMNGHGEQTHSEWVEGAEEHKIRFEYPNYPNCTEIICKRRT